MSEDHALAVGTGDSNRKIILLVDDSSDDALLIQRELRRAGALNGIRHVTTGERAIRYLAGKKPFDDRDKNPLPALLLLDLKLPGKTDGYGVLEWVRSQPDFDNLVIIVVSDLSERTNLRRAYALGANSYIVKPGNEDEFTNLIKAFPGSWLVEPELVHH